MCAQPCSGGNRLLIGNSSWGARYLACYADAAVSYERLQLSCNRRHTKIIGFHPIFARYFSGPTFANRCKLKRLRRAKKSDQARAGYVRRIGVEQALNRKTSVTVFKFPVASFSEIATGAEKQFSVSSTYRESRVIVTVTTIPDGSANCAVSCSGRDCQP